MTLSAQLAKTYTSSAAGTIYDQQLQQDVSLAEKQIRTAASRGLYTTIFNARTIGNPPEDPSNTSTLTSLQYDFYNTYLQAGYRVGLDAASGWWSFRWEPTGPESLTKVYLIYTSLTSTSIQAGTITAINNYFQGLTPVVHARTFLNNPTGSSGDVDETVFGAATSHFCLYVSVVDQVDRVDHSGDLATALSHASLGYVIAGSPNLKVYLGG